MRWRSILDKSPIIYFVNFFMAGNNLFFKWSRYRRAFIFKPRPFTTGRQYPGCVWLPGSSSEQINSSTSIWFSIAVAVTGRPEPSFLSIVPASLNFFTNRFTDDKTQPLLPFFPYFVRCPALFNNIVFYDRFIFVMLLNTMLAETSHKNLNNDNSCRMWFVWRKMILLTTLYI